MRRRDFLTTAATPALLRGQDIPLPILFGKKRPARSGAVWHLWARSASSATAATTCGRRRARGGALGRGGGASTVGTRSLTRRPTVCGPGSPATRCAALGGGNPLWRWSTRGTGSVAPGQRAAGGWLCG